MALHHRREIYDMRSAFDHADAPDERPHGQVDRREHSMNSAEVRATHQVSHQRSSGSPEKWSRKPPQVHNPPKDTHRDDKPMRYFNDKIPQESPRASVASTVESEEELPEYFNESNVSARSPEPREMSAIPATPSEFSQLFPSRRKLMIRHDDSTLDGNMNLRLDTEIHMHNRKCDMTLFHLRMHDLAQREFSLRRYCRDSGREVCHSAFKHQKSASEKRQSLPRSLSNAWNSVTSKSDSKDPLASELKRYDSGYGSMHSVDFDNDRRPRSAGREPRKQSQAPGNTIGLEFSNYAHVDVRRTGVKGSKRYEFEYWGTSYSWRRRKDQKLNEVSFYLTKSGCASILGYIRTVPLSAGEADEEGRLGGWIRPSSMWIEDEMILRSQKDVSDVVVSAGLIALVDDTIRTHFVAKHAKRLRDSSTKLQTTLAEGVRPADWINEIFSRKDSTSSHERYLSSKSRPSSSSRQSATGHGPLPLRRPKLVSRQSN